MTAHDEIILISSMYKREREREREMKKRKRELRPLPVFFMHALSSVSCQLFRNTPTPREISLHANSSNSHALVEIACKMSTLVER